MSAVKRKPNPITKRVNGRPRGGATFICPKCKEITKVLRTVRIDPEKLIHRQRKCLSCGNIFDTREVHAR
jgi:RNase P subunit RPR2